MLTLRAGFPRRMPLPPWTSRVSVVDASVLAAYLGDAGGDGQRFRNRLRGETVLGPGLLRVQVTSVLSRHLSTGLLTSDQADVASTTLWPSRSRCSGSMCSRSTCSRPAPLPRIWELRFKLYVYDSCYVALVEAVDAIPLTADHRLARAATPRCI